jgi:hypothetical protein
MAKYWRNRTVKTYLKYGVSSIALLAAFSLAQAQERQGSGERGGGAQQMQGEQGGATKHEGATENRGSPSKEKGLGEQKGKTAQQEPGTAKNRAEAEHGNKGERGTTQNHQGTQAPGNRAAKNAPTEEQRDQSRQREDTGTRQKESNVGGAAKSESLGREGAGTSKRTSFQVSGAQKTELHDFIGRDKAMRRYHRGDIHFSVNPGSRVPDDFEFYAPPPRFVEINPEFRNYMIVVLDDEILVIDPVTREIVDVIPT